MSKQEEAFFEVWDKIEPHTHLYNHRMMFDLGYKAAEERIIKLLNTDEAFDAVYYGIELGADHVIGGLIALIKGENQ